MKVLDIKKCSYCNKDVEIQHKKRLTNKNIFCAKVCEARFRTKAPNTRCSVCKKPLSVKPSRLKRLKHSICCSKECSNLLKSTYYKGESNPNHKYTKDLSCIYNLTADGSYILGFIYADGHMTKNSISISQKSTYKIILEKISYMIFNDNLVTTSKGKSTLYINDVDLVNYIVSLGGINIGKKAAAVEIPNIPEDKKWPFICGYFDGDGGFKYNYRYPEISISSNSSKILQQIADYWGVNYAGKDKIYASGFKALDICGKMYESCSLYHPKKKYYYEDILNWEPLPGGPWEHGDYFKFKKLTPEAIAPEKKRVTDSGYDVHVISLDYDEQTGLYKANTQIAIEPKPGYYFDLIGRSSLPKNGFHFVGGVGIIDRSYVGPLIMMLQKINDNADKIELPFKCGQLIPRKIVHAKFIEVENLSDSDRGEGSFGSTDNLNKKDKNNDN